MFAVAPALCVLPLFASATAVEEAAAQTAADPVTKLLYTIATTSLAIGVGCLAVRLGFVDPERGQMVALRWYVRMVAFPLLVFRVVATSPIGALQLDQWYVVLSCAVGKLFVMVTVWLLAFYCHHGSSTETSQRLLTATCFMYFVASSDDFAVGFPVVTAIYKNELGMDLYVTINALIWNAVFLPIVTILLEVGRNMALAESARGGVTDDEFSGSDSGSDVDTSNDESIVTKEKSNKDEIEGSGALVVSLAIAKSVAFSPVIVSVALGLMYGSIFGTVIPELGTMIIDKLTSPFGMLALFATGTVLKQPSLQLWSCLLSLLKVVVCAYVSFFTARFLMGSEGRLTDFCFFYGSLPTSSGPLIFTVHYNPGLVDTVASATLFGYCLAGPVMSFTAMFLEQESVSPDILSNAQRVVSGVSFLLGMLFILSLVASGARGRWGFSSRGKISLAVFGVASTAMSFFAWKDSFNPCNANSGPREVSTSMFFETWLVRWCSWLLVLMQALTGPWSFTSGIVLECGAILAISLATLVSAVMHPGARSLNMECKYTDTSNATLIDELVAGLSVFAILTGLELFRLHGKTIGRAAPSANGDGEAWHSVPPTVVVKPLVFLELAHLFFALVNCSVQSAGLSLTGSFVSMLMIEGFMLQAQGACLFAALLLSPAFSEELKRWVEDWTPWRASGVPQQDCDLELPGASLRPPPA